MNEQHPILWVVNPVVAWGDAVERNACPRLLGEYSQ